MRTYKRYVAIGMDDASAIRIAESVVGRDKCNRWKPAMSGWWSLRIRASRQEMDEIERRWAVGFVRVENRRPRGAELPKRLERVSC